MSRYPRPPPPPLSDTTDVGKDDPLDDEEESNASLITQTLNADGTPKRPMNAFMIFARRRRPQVSAENQSMRTGEISKLLSKEWNTMLVSDKQFYLDQAKQLKDAFNARYPDYVYRRRPNNSRRRRPRSAGDVPVPVAPDNEGSPLTDEDGSKSDSASDPNHHYSEPHRHQEYSNYPPPSHDISSYQPRSSQTGPSPRISPSMSNFSSNYYGGSSAHGHPPYPESSSSNWSHSRGDHRSAWTAERSSYSSSQWSPTSPNPSSATAGRGSSYPYPNPTSSSSYYPPPTSSTSENAPSPTFRHGHHSTTSSSVSPPPYTSGGGSGALLDRYFTGSSGRDNAGAAGYSSSASYSTSRAPPPLNTDGRAALTAGRGLPSLNDQFSPGGFHDPRR